VLACSDDKDARATVIALARDAGLRGIDAGPLAKFRRSRGGAHVAADLDQLNLQGVDAGIDIIGLPAAQAAV
jgi:predicted dinucleotide-binding enzyme